MLGNEGAYLPGDGNGGIPKKYWNAVSASVEILKKEGLLNEKDKENFLNGMRSRLTPNTTLPLSETISSGELIDKYLEASKKPVDHEGLYTGLYSLDKMLLGIQEQNFMVICARTGVGKCERKGTKILMADGTTKKIEDIEIGEQVQGLDGPRTVLAKHSGFGKCYKITPKKGEPFFVSDSHIMTCMRYKEQYSHHKVVGWEHYLEDILIEDLMKKKKHSDDTFTHYKLYRPAVEYERKTLELDPYILGIWLGDGTSDGNSLTTIDNEIRDAWLSLATDKHRIRKVLTGNATTYFIATDSRDLAICKIFEKLGVRNNKHIPLRYLTGDREQRLQLLAGIVDTDGSLTPNGTFEVIQKNELLADQIAQLSRGLGFSVTRKTKTIKGKTYQRLFISGDVHKIPTKLPRKQAPERKCPKDPLVTGFKVEQVEDAEYYGIQVDKDSHFLLWDNTITHNTLVANYMVGKFAEQGQKILYLALEESEQEVGDRWAKVVMNNNLQVPPDSVDFLYAETVSFIKEDKYNIIPLIAAASQLGYTMICVDMLNNLIDTVRDENSNVFLNRIIDQTHKCNMTLLMTARLRQPLTDQEKDFPSMESVYGRVDLGYIVSKCIGVTALPDEGDGKTRLRLHILKNRRKRIGMKMTYPRISVTNLLELQDEGDDSGAAEQLQDYENNVSRTKNYHPVKQPKGDTDGADEAF